MFKWTTQIFLGEKPAQMAYLLAYVTFLQLGSSATGEPSVALEAYHLRKCRWSDADFSSASISKTLDLRLQLLQQHRQRGQQSMRGFHLVYWSY